MELVVKRVTKSPHLSPVVPQELKQFLRFYFNGALKSWENTDKLQRDRAIRYLTDLEQIPSTGRRLWDAVTADQMDTIRSEIGGLRVRVQNQSRPGWLIHCLKCWCGFYDPTSDEYKEEFKEWPPLKDLHTTRALRELWSRITKVLNGEYQ